MTRVLNMAKKSTSAQEPSSVIQMGVVFVVIAAMVLVAMAVKMYTP